MGGRGELVRINAYVTDNYKCWQVYTRAKNTTFSGKASHFLLLQEPGFLEESSKSVLTNFEHLMHWNEEYDQKSVEQLESSCFLFFRQGLVYFCKDN